jgi:hypothetical protein
MTPRVSRAVLGEKSAPARENHSSGSWPTVAFVRANAPRSAWATIAASARWASRLPPRYVW